MTKNKFIIVTLVIACLCLVFTACDNQPQKLATPQNLAYSNGAITYSAVENASGYKLFIDGTTDLEIECGASVSYTYLPTETVKVKVMAVGDGQKFTDSDYSAEITITYTPSDNGDNGGDGGDNPPPQPQPAEQLASVTDITLTNNILSWTAVENAAGYKVTIDGNTTLTTDQAQLQLETLAAGNHSVVVVAVGDGKDYLDSLPTTEQLTVNVQLLAPTHVTFDMATKTLHWDGVQNATGYVVTVGDQEPIQIASYVYSCDMTAFGDVFQATIVAVGNGFYSNSVAANITVDLSTVVEIATEQDLAKLALGGKFKLVEDIVLTQNWTPVDFWGEFDGNGKTISNLVVESNSQNVGLFDTINYAQISNLTIDGADLSGVANKLGYAGILAAQAFNCTITGVKATNCTVNSTNRHFGGLIGGLQEGSIALEKCSANVTATLAGGVSAGGFVGVVSSNLATISSCFATGSISGAQYLGGFVGRMGYGAISNCYSQTTLYCKGLSAGGFVGYVDGRNATITSSYTASTVSGSEDCTLGAFGGVVPTGSFNQGNVFKNCYFDSTICTLDRIGNYQSGHATGITGSKSLKNGNLPTGLNSEFWQAESESYPTLK